jgi:hypothetical protein
MDKRYKDYILQQENVPIRTSILCKNHLKCKKNQNFLKKCDGFLNLYLNMTKFLQDELHRDTQRKANFTKTLE